MFRSLFIDGLVASATNPSFLFIKKLIEDKKVHGLRAQSMLSRLSLNIKESSETLFEEYYVRLEKFNTIFSYKEIFFAHNNSNSAQVVLFRIRLN